MGYIFWVAKIANIFLECLKILIFFFWGGGGGVEQYRKVLGPSLRMEKNDYPPPPPPPLAHRLPNKFVNKNTQVNRMSKSRRVLATGGKQRSFGLHMVCFEMVLYHNEPH